MADKPFYKTPAFIVSATLITAGGAAYGISKLSKKLKEKKQENTVNQVDSKDPKRALASTLAQRAYTAFFPSGYPGLWDGTDEAALYSLAKQMYQNKIPFAYLTEAYRKLYNRQFAQDLADELSADELSKFYSNYQKGFGSVTAGFRPAITRRAIKTIRKTPNVKLI